MTTQKIMEAQKTALYPVHVQSKALLRPFAGFMMPIHYGSIIKEHQAVREQAGLFDVSHMCKFQVEGKEAFDLLQYISSNDVGRLSIGGAQYTCLPNESGGIIDDALIYKMNERRYLFVGNASNREKDWRWFKQHQETYKAKLTDVSDNESILALQGPNASAILQKLTDLALDSIPFYNFAHSKVADISDVLISHTGYTGAGGYELYLDNNHAPTLWKTLIETGKEYGLQPAGLGARDTLRLEMGYLLHGQDIDETTSPIEAGLGWITKLNKTFIGCEYLRKQKLQGIPKRLVSLILDEAGGIPRAGYPIVDEQDLKVGEVTSGGHSITLQKGIALGYVASSYSKPHTKLHISIRKRNFAAEIVKFPAWKKN